MEQWHESKWKVLIPEDRRSDLERFLGRHGFTVKRWVNYVPDIEGDYDSAAVIELTETWLRGDVDTGQAQAIAEGSLIPQKTLKSETIQEASAPVQHTKKKRTSKKKGGA